MKRVIFAALAAAIIFFLLFITIRCGRGVSRAEEPAEKEEGTPYVTLTEKAISNGGIEVVEASRGTVRTTIDATGVLKEEPSRLVRVTARCSGRVRALLAGEGDAVTQGAPLLILESSEVAKVRADLAQARARLDLEEKSLVMKRKLAALGAFGRRPLEEAVNALAEARSEYASSVVELDRARKELKRRESLAGLGAYSARSLEEARSALAAAQGESEAAGAEAEKAKRELERRKQLAALGTYGERPLEEAQRSLSEAQAALRSAEAEHGTAKAALDRTRELFAGGISSRRELEEAQARYDSAVGQVERARAQMEVARTSYGREKKIRDQEHHTSREVEEAQADYAQAQAALTGAAADLEVASEYYAREKKKLEGGHSAQKEVEEAQADYAKAQAAMKKAATQLDVASAYYEREKKKGERNHATQKELEEAQADCDKAQAQVRRGAARLKVAEEYQAREARAFEGRFLPAQEIRQAQLEVEKARIEIDGCTRSLLLLGADPGSPSDTVTVTAPLTGTVTKQEATLGQAVEAASPLFTVVNTKTLWAVLAVHEKDLDALKEGSPAIVRVLSLPGLVVTGRVSRAGQSIDPDLRTSGARVVVANPAGRLKPGMFVKAQIEGPESPALRVPRQAVQRQGGRDVVYVALPGGKFEARTVRVGVKNEEHAQVLEGLRRGERVVSKGSFTIKSEFLKGSMEGD